MTTSIQTATSIQTSVDPLRWDLTSIYPSLTDPRIEADLRSALSQAQALSSKFKTRVSSLTPTEALELITGLEDVQYRMHRPSWFAGLMFSAQTDDSAVLALQDRVRGAATAIANEITWAELELTQLPETTMNTWLASSELGAYKHFIRAHRRFADHTLSEPEEKILNLKNLTGRSAWTQLYTEITSSIRISLEVDGTTQELTVDQVRALRSRPERDLRQRAVAALAAALAERSHVLTYIANVLYQDWKINTDLRRYENPMTPTALNDELPVAALEAMMTATERNADIIQTYFKLKANALGITDFSSHDLLAPLNDSPTVYSFEQGKDLVLESFARFHQKAESLARDFFDGQRIDIMPRPGKRGGAFCSSFDPRDPAFILLNFNSRLDDVFTLAHELGHGLHAELSRVQKTANFGHSTPLAETASLFCEMLVMDNLLEQADASTRRELLANQIEDAAGTIFRQVQITRWEQLAHQERASGIVSSERYNQLWLQTCQVIYGDAVTMPETDGAMWSGIPHVFSYRFYCYSYAFGNLLVFALYQRYKQEGASFAPKYLEFLSSGESASPQELMQRLGVDLNDPNFWQAGFDYLRGVLEQFKAVA
jgi:oligoendopeptidase F